MKTISAKRHIAAFGAMLVATIGGMAFAAPTAGLDGDVYYVSVPAGEVVNASDANWSSWVSAASGHAFAKRGAGVLKAGAAMASFTGEIRVEGGIYAATADGALGTTAGGTVVSNNATLLIAGGTHTYEPLYLSGTGCHSITYDTALLSDAGALWWWGGGRTFNNVALIGDATVRGGAHTFGGTLKMNGHTLNVKLNDVQYFTFDKTNIETMGNIVVESGCVWFSGLTSAPGGDEWSVTVKSGGILYNWGTTSGAKLPWRLVLENGAAIRSGYGTIVWSGPTTIAASAIVDRYVADWAGWSTGISLDGVVSGNGSLEIRNGEYLELTNPANDFTGSMALNGVNTVTNPTLRVFNNALPATSAGVTMNYGNVVLNGSLAVSGVDTNRFSLPKIACTSSGSVVCKDSLAFSGNRQTVKEVSKSGAGVMTLTGPLCVTGRTEVTAGTLRLGSRLPAVQTGLECYFLDVIHSPYYNPTYGTGNGYGNQGPWTYVANIDEPPFTRKAGYWNGSFDYTEVELEYQGIDTNGISLAYKSWPVKMLDVIYRGYLWVDGNESVTWNFAANIHNYCRLRIDGQDIIVNRDVARSASSTVADRLTTSSPITLTPGAHSFSLYMATYGNAHLNGPAHLSAPYGWDPNMGVVYNPNPGDVISSNSTDYVKFTASQFSPTLNRGKANLDSSLYRASFDGGAKFAAGTVFDIGDTAPYTPFPLTNLEGAMTVTNGTLVLSGSWTIDAAEINAGGLVLTGDANLVFADGATLTVTNASQIRRKGSVGMPLVTCAGTGTVTGRPTVLMEEGGWKLYEKDGNLNIYRPTGAVLIFK